MRLDQATFAFGFTIRNSAGNPNWGTSLGQGKEHKINSFADVEEILKGMVYSSVSLDRIELRMGKGGALRKGSDPSAGLVVGSVFNKVFVNDDLVEDCTLILVINKDLSPSHFGRLRLKYSPSNSFIRDDGTKVSNEDGLSKIRGKLGIASDACWFVHALTILNQDELHLSVVVVNNAHPVEYKTTADLHAAWGALIGDPEDESIPKSETLSNQKEQIIFNVDRLSVALKLFAEKRKDDGAGGWFKSGREVNGRIREYFDPLTLTALQAFDDAKIEELFCGKKGADGKVELETMWSGKNGQGWGNIKPKTPQETQDVREFLCKLKTDPGVVAAFRQTGFLHPNGFGPSVISELLMKFHPELCIKHGEVGHKVLTWLGLIDSAWNREYSDGDYKQVCGAAAKILTKMNAMKIPRQINADKTEDTSPPDYLTVNEFIWFVNENMDFIKEKVMSKAMKRPTTMKITTGKATISKLLDNKEDSLMTMLVAGLLTKPLAILAGVSGTGKSRMVRHLAYKTCLDEDLKPNGESAPGNFKMVQVKPSWHDSADLLGYRSAVNEKHEYVSTDFVKFVLKAHAYPNTPFFVCLDEMNLAPVEHYFAEFLSACESIRKSDVTGEWTSDPIVTATDFDNNVLNLGGDVLFESTDAALDAKLKKTKERIEKEGVFIPRNLFVVGTVNMDDSTGGFSRKVLDRAMTIVMNEVHFEDLQKDDKDLTISDDNLFTTAEIAKFIERKDFDKDMMSDDFRDQLEDIRQKLAKTPFALAYRFARETCMYKNELKEILDAAEVVKDSEGNPKKDASGVAIDAGRACGDIALDHMILMKLLPRLTGTTEQRSEVLKNIKEYLGKLVKDKKVSAVTLDEMEGRAKGNGGYLSFWP